LDYGAQRCNANAEKEKRCLKVTTDRFVQLQEGGVIAFEEYGDANGVPVIFCHGWPSSRTMARLTEAAAGDLGIRIISPDRPGISGSSLQPNRELSDWPPVVRQLADHLGIGAFYVIGISGGAPYAYATAIAMPERAKAVAIVSGATPIVDLAHHEGLLPLYRWMLAFYRWRPQLLRKLFCLARPILSLRPPIPLRPLILKMLMLRSCDEESLRDSAAFEAVFESQRRAWLGSAEGVIADAQIYAKPWGFSLDAVQVPVRLWHGKEDRAFSVRLAEEIANRLPDCKPRYVTGAGHYSLPIRHIREILEDLISSPDRSA
jgi:pimeloyl-ACP methyl ester carboxylesterase